MGAQIDSETEITDALYRGACDFAELTRALELVAEYFNSSGVVLGAIDPLQMKCQVVIGTGVVNARELERYRQYAHLDPMPRAFAASAAGTVITSKRVIPDGEPRSVFMREYLLPLGAKETLGCHLYSNNGRSAAISILQGIERKSYDDDDVARLERLTPHLTRTLQIRRLFLQSEARGKVLESIVDRNETGIIGLSGGGPALFVNDAARRVAAARDGISLDRQGRPVAADRVAATRLAALHGDVARGGAGGVVRISRPSGLKPYVVLVSPLPSGDDLFPKSRGGVLFAIHDPANRKTPTEQRIAELLHIPLGAAKVLQAILEGKDLKEYAERAGISMNTVRFHLKSAFALTGTRSQAGLVRSALAALNELGPYFPDSP